MSETNDELTAEEWKEKALSGEKNLKNANLSQLNLKNIDLDEANLDFADFSHSNLEGASLSYGSINNADFTGACLDGAYCIEAEMIGACFTGVVAHNTSFTGSNLAQADFFGTDLELSCFEMTDLTDTDFRESNLERVNLSRSALNNTQFQHAILTNTIIDNASISGANFSQVILDKTIFSNVNLSEVIGLGEATHSGYSIVDNTVLSESRNLPLSFLRGIGLSDVFIDYIPSLFSRGIQFYSCFISHSSEDKEFARRVYDTLQGHGIRCWMDEKELLPGDDIHDVIDHGIRMWDKVLLCASKNSLTSWWVDDEMEKAFQKEQRLTKERGKKVLSLIPINLDGYMFSDDYVSGKKSQLRKRVAADFMNWKDHDQFSLEIENVVNALRSDGGGRSPTPEPKL